MLDSRLLPTLALLLAIAPSFGQERNIRPPQGSVPNAQTAIAIAVAVWTPIYGKEQIEAERPYRATLSQGKWTVTGSTPGGIPGGAAIAIIDKSDGQILRVDHSR